MPRRTRADEAAGAARSYGRFASRCCPRPRQRHVAVGLARRHVHLGRRLPPDRLHDLEDVGHVQHVVAVAEQAVAGVVEDRQPGDEARRAVGPAAEHLVPLAHNARPVDHDPVLGRRPAVPGKPRHRLDEELADRLATLDPSPGGVDVGGVLGEEVRQHRPRLLARRRSRRARRRVVRRSGCASRSIASGTSGLPRVAELGGSVTGIATGNRARAPRPAGRRSPLCRSPAARHDSSSPWASRSPGRARRASCTTTTSTRRTSAAPSPSSARRARAGWRLARASIHGDAPPVAASLVVQHPQRPRTTDTDHRAPARPHSASPPCPPSPARVSA